MTYDFPQSCCHTVKGLSRSVSLDIFSSKITALHRMHASTADLIFCLCFDIFQIVVVYVVDSMEESQSTIPAAISLLMSHIFDPLLHVHLCGSCAIQEICFCGSLIILICRFEIDGSVRLALELIGHLICESIKRSCLS